mmetsp:Transcript_104305/g.162589  ORF Transcript_104305/g.162589 Transcript_104305/m.162589 type:complete len:660 (+) Transcript_104305:1-1980(+)
MRIASNDLRSLSLGDRRELLHRGNNSRSELDLPSRALRLFLLAHTSALAGSMTGYSRSIAGENGFIVGARLRTRRVPSRGALMEAPESIADRPHVAVVGGGWGGWGAAKALVENGCRVTLLDALPDPTGRTPYLTPTGKPFEAGTRGFWFDYPNINALVTDDLGLREGDVFTSFTNSSFYSPDGLEATAPVFSQSAFPELPSPLGQVFATFSLFERIPVPDRVTMFGLLLAMIDYTRDEETFKAYDRMSAQQLFIQMGISPRLVQDFIKPTLLIGLFKSPEELSAAVSMELLYFYALAHQTAFDVRWIKSRSISELIIAPLAESLAKKMAPVLPEAEEQDAETKEEPVLQEAEAKEEPLLRVLGGSFVESLKLNEDSGLITGLTYLDREKGESATLDNLSGVVLSLGSKGMKSVMRGSPDLAKAAPELASAASLDAIDVIAVRLWLDKTVPTRTPANVFSRFESLMGAGGTFFMLDQLQNEDPSLLWGEDEVQGSVVACDFYNAGALLPFSDEEIVRRLMEDLLPKAVPEFASATVVDSYVQRYPGAVTWFSPGSFMKRPPLQTSISNLVCAGDWVRLGNRETKAKGLCQERAFVSGLEAANALARSGMLGLRHTREHKVREIRDDEPQVIAARKLNKIVADVLKPLGITPNPYARPEV